MVSMLLLLLALSPPLVLGLNSPNSFSNCSAGFQGPNCDECGVVYYKPNQKIVGGQNAVSHSWPAQVFIGIWPFDNQTFNQKDIFQCGGTLISRDTVLTAAHCIETYIKLPINDTFYYEVPLDLNETLPFYKIYLGYQDRTTNSDGFGVIANVSNIIIHPDYRGENIFLNDIAIIKLTSPVTLSRAIQIACLPSMTSNDYPSQYGSSVYVSGWGDTSDGGLPSNILKNVALILYNPTKCLKSWPEYPKNWNSQICAGFLPGGKDSCQGDSGGGLYIKDTVNNMKKDVVVGIVSYGPGCELPKTAGIYTRVSYFLPWIYRNMYQS